MLRGLWQRASGWPSLQGPAASIASIVSCLPSFCDVPLHCNHLQFLMPTPPVPFVVAQKPPSHLHQKIIPRIPCQPSHVRQSWTSLKILCNRRKSPQVTQLPGGYHFITRKMHKPPYVQIKLQNITLFGPQKPKPSDTKSSLN